MTPMIDVVFLLLIFFMLTSTFIRPESLEMKLPSASSAQANPPTPMVVSISAAGEVQLDGQALAVEALAERAQRVFAENPETPVLVQADARGQVQRVVAVMDRLRRAGGRRLLLATEPTEGAR